MKRFTPNLSKNLAFLLAILVVLSATLVSGNAQKIKSHFTSSNNAIYAVPRYWPTQDIVMFKDNAASVKFRLITSWIPGKDMKGVMRYQLYVTLLRPNVLMQSPNVSSYAHHDEIEKFMSRIFASNIYLNFIDKYGFNLRTEKIFFHYTVDENSRIVGLSANSSIAMSIDEYKILFKGTDGYDVNWLDLNELKP